MKPILTALFIAAIGLALGQTKYSVEMGGKMVGSASLSQKISGDGAKTVDLKMDLKLTSQKLSIRSQNTYDKQGQPIRKFMDANIPGGALQRQLVATFDERGANVVQMDGGKRTTRQIPLVGAAPRSDASEYWFIRDLPKPGEKVRTYTFNMDLLAWQLQTTVYRGRKIIKVNGKSIEAHEVEIIGDRPSKAFLDEKGVPWIVESGSTILRRVVAE
jgi:hypothetical protein